MNCWRIDLQRKLILYVHGELPENENEQIVNHLVKCSSCRDHAARLGEGDRLAAQLEKRHGQNAWAKIERVITTQPQQQDSHHALLGLAAALVASLVLVLIWKNAQQQTVRFETAPYRIISLGQFPHIDEAHVATDGYVTEVRKDPEDGDLMFKLVDDLHQPKNFVICEILPAWKLDAPAVGSKVRVYGVSRYDGHPEHQWFEVHPVLNIENLR